MIICVCANVSDKEIQEIKHLSLEEVMMQTGAAMCCGCCFKALQELCPEEPLLNIAPLR